MLTKKNATINPDISIKFFIWKRGKAVSLWTGPFMVQRKLSVSEAY